MDKKWLTKLTKTKTMTYRLYSVTAVRHALSKKLNYIKLRQLHYYHFQFRQFSIANHIYPNVSINLGHDLTNVIVNIVSLPVGQQSTLHRDSKFLAISYEAAVFTFYRAMLCVRGTSHGPVSVCLCLCLSQVGVLLKRQNMGSHKNNTTR